MRAIAGVVPAVCLVLGLTACGGSSKSGPVNGLGSFSDTADDHPSWYAVKGAGATRIEVRFIGTPPQLADTDPCAEQYRAAVSEQTASVVITLTRQGRARGSKCTTTIRSTTVTLRAPVGKRTIVNGTTQTRYGLGPGGGYFEQPVTTATTQPPAVPAACTAASYDEAVRDEIDGGLQISDEHCQGAFLRLSYRHRECAPGTCADDRPTIAYFVAIDRRWHVVTLARGLTCAQVLADVGVRFPAAVC